jgi:hypothetical protein
MSNNNKIWFEDIVNFINEKNYFVIIPLGQMSIEDKINAILRFLLYFGILLTLIRMDTRYIMIPVIAGLVSIVVYKYETRRKDIIETELERRDLDIVNNKVCTRVTIDNPFMNPSIADITFNPDKPAACDITNEAVSKNIENKFNARVFQDVNDIFNNKASQRQFYTLPSTTIPNNRHGLANWLYNRGPSCKEGNGDQCWRNKVNIGVQGRGHS